MSLQSCPSGPEILLRATLDVSALDPMLRLLEQGWLCKFGATGRDVVGLGGAGLDNFGRGAAGLGGQN
ncbi:hypothetical protein PC113_g21496 [Phytophthora cactorum]|uniref:Uncharacterized protein n=1 Tax=Phytophthora cactorum TaxID=29920 RepID=A0A8T0YIZ2_9STRA|nr:hypothetical protein PC113_g21496 [Phytophthora cactorum]KAG2893748.1 hypothetical protein PC117_g23688 [Phytophthora cactorum]